MFCSLLGWYGCILLKFFESGGTVVVLNHLVDAWAEKERKNQFHPTYDYSELDYSQFESIETEVHTGDFYIFNGQFLHAVTGYKGIFLHLSSK